MKKIMCGIAAILCYFSAAAQGQAQLQRLTDHVYYLANDSMNGRKAGTEDAAKAADYIVRQYESAGLKPLFAEGWYDTFSLKSYTKGEQFQNVVGVIEGSDPALKDEYIVLGAHYDHLGIKNDKVYNGADDNASGSAALIEVARTLAADRECLGRSVIIAAFDAEEIGLYGSSHLAERLDSMGMKVKLMMSIDMVGWLEKNQALELEGTATIKDGRRLLSEKAEKISLSIKPKRYERSVFTATDTEGFAKKGIPTLAVSTGLKSPYHKPEDDADLIDYKGLNLVTDYVGEIACEWSADPEFAASGKVAPKHRTKSPVGLDFGVMAGWNSTTINFKDAGLQSAGRYGWAAGAELQANFKNLGIWADAIYNVCNSNFPNPDDVFRSSYRYNRTELIVPVSLVFQTPRNLMGGAYIGAGAYWSKAFSTEVKGYDGCPALKEDGFGWQVIAGVKVSKIQFGLTGLYQLGNLFEDSGSASARQVCTMFNLKYIF